MYRILVKYSGKDDTIDKMDESYPYIEDKNAVMERLGGNEALLKRLLKKFHDAYINTGKTLLSEIESSNQEESYRIVHTLKGVSANLGFGRLYRSAIALETRMKAGEYDSLQEEMTAFITELDAVIHEMETGVCT